MKALIEVLVKSTWL